MISRFAVTMALLALQIGCAAPAEPHSPEDLIQYIHAAEREEIRESWGEDAGECFTWLDYQMFVKDERPRAVANRFKATPEFRATAEMIRKLPDPERKVLFERARLAVRPTWAMIGRISREGTTDAGREAALLLAAAMVDAVEQELKQR